LAREALLGGSQGLDRLNSTKIAESGQIRARPQKGNIKTERPRAGPERPHHPPHRPPRGPMDAPRWAKAPHDQPTCPSPPAPACYAHALVLKGEKNLMGGFHAETKNLMGGFHAETKRKSGGPIYGRNRPCAADRGHQGGLWHPLKHRGRYGGARVGARGRAWPRAIDRARKCRKIRI
jgi:hypothetical protein